MKKTFIAVLLSALLPFFWAAAATAQEPDGNHASGWKQFRGVDGAGIAEDTGLQRSWPEEGPKELWRRAVGTGLSGIVADGDRLCTLFAGETETLLGCFRVADGGELWRLPIGESFQDEFGRGPRSTPTIDGGMIFALGGRGRLVAAELASGRLIWQVELTEDYGFYGPQPTPTGISVGELQIPIFSYASSPLVEGDLIVFEAGTGKGKSIVALDKRTGELRWTALDEPGIAYASPVAVTIAGQRQILVYRPTALVSLLPNGQVRWQMRWFTTVSQPVFLPPNRIFLATANISGLGSPEVETKLIAVTGGDGEVAIGTVWESHIMRNHWNSSVAYRGHIYGFDNATLRCLDAETGESVWARRGLGKGTLLIADGLLILWSDQGKLTLAEAVADGYQQKGQVRVFEEGRTWTPPALADGRLYLRGNTDVVSYDLRK